MAVGQALLLPHPSLLLPHPSLLLPHPWLRPNLLVAADNWGLIPRRLLRTQAQLAMRQLAMHPFALLAAMERDIPNYPNKYDVKSYGARGDGSGGARCG